MATVTGMTAAAMQAIKNSAIVGAVVDAAGNLIFTKQDQTTYGPFNIKGPTGTTGSIQLSGAGVPATSLGKVTDWYLNTTNGDYYEKTATAVWTLRMNLKGPTGSSGVSAYPIGAIYMSVSPTNPATLLGGGTWVAWGSGRVPVAVNASDTEFDTVEEIGGSKTVVLSTNNIPAHSHGMLHSHPDFALIRKTAAGSSSGVVRGGGTLDTDLTVNIVNTTKTDTDVNTTTGASVPNLPPYITCYMWKRTA